jgi:hypothetical protein
MNASPNITVFDKLGFTPSRVIRVFGMRRSGNHALINWLMRNGPEFSVFLNNCVPGKCPADTARALEIGNLGMSLHEKSVPEHCAEVPDGGMLVISYEDFMPDANEPVQAANAGLPEDIDCLDLVLFRGFMNWSASLLRKLQNNDAHDMLSRLRTMIGAMDRYTECLELVQEAPARVRPISYDRWVSRARYRNRILRALELEAKDNSLGRVQNYGGGSSFQKNVKSATDLTPHERWHQMVNDAEYQLLLLTASQHSELVDLMEDLMPQDASLIKGYLAQARFPYHIEFAEDDET